MVETSVLDNFTGTGPPSSEHMEEKVGRTKTVSEKKPQDSLDWRSSVPIGANGQDTALDPETILDANFPVDLSLFPERIGVLSPGRFGSLELWLGWFGAQGGFDVQNTTSSANGP